MAHLLKKEKVSIISLSRNIGKIRRGPFNMGHPLVVLQHYFSSVKGINKLCYHLKVFGLTIIQWDGA